MMKPLGKHLKTMGKPPYSLWNTSWSLKKILEIQKKKHKENITEALEHHLKTHKRPTKSNGRPRKPTGTKVRLRENKKVRNWKPKRGQGRPRGGQRDANGAQKGGIRRPNGGQKETQGSQKETQRGQGEAEEGQCRKKFFRPTSAPPFWHPKSSRNRTKHLKNGFENNAKYKYGFKLLSVPKILPKHSS